MHRLEGQRFGRLRVLAIARRASAGRKITWRCACDCGGFSLVLTDRLKSGKTKSCGCLKEENRRRVCGFINLTGQRFGSLTTLQLLSLRDINGGRVWLCRCDCGAYRNVPSNSLRRGLTRSCGCLRNKIKVSAGQKGSHHRWYPSASQQEYSDLINAKKLWKGLETYVRQQRNEYQTQAP